MNWLSVNWFSPSHQNSLPTLGCPLKATLSFINVCIYSLADFKSTFCVSDLILGENFLSVGLWKEVFSSTVRIHNG